MHRPPLSRSIRSLNRSRAGRAGLIVALILLAALGMIALMLATDRALPPPEADGDGDTPGAEASSGDPTADPDADQLARELAAAYFAQDDRGKAAAAIAPLVERAHPAAEDLVSAAAIALKRADVEAARGYLEQAAALAPDAPRVNYNLARLARWDGDYAASIPYLQAVRSAQPEDLPTLLMLGDSYEIIEQPDEARAVYGSVLARGVDASGAWHLTALYRMSLIARDAGDEQASASYREEFSLLQGRGLTPPNETQLDVGFLGAIPAPPPRGNTPGGSGRLPKVLAPSAVLASFAQAERMLAADMDNDGRLDAVGWGQNGGVVLALNRPSGWEERTLSTAGADVAVAYDFGNDDDLDLLLTSGGELRLLVAEAGAEAGSFEWRPWPGTLPELPSAVSEALAVDYDHEGDLDLVVVGAFGVLLLRDDGAAGLEGAYTDVTDEAGLGALSATAGVFAEDFDTDQDLDLLFWDGFSLRLFSNLRGGALEEVTAERLAGLPVSGKFPPFVADLDGDGRPDLPMVAQDGSLEIWGNGPSGRFHALPGRERKLPLGGTTSSLALDLDLDGALDLVDLQRGELHGILALGLPEESDFTLGLESDRLARSGRGSFAVVDLEGDLSWDLLNLSVEGLVVRPTEAENFGLRLGYRGLKDNRRGLGAVVEVRSGPVYRRVFWKGEAELVGVGRRTETDLVRVTWPNGVVQYDDRRELGDRAATGDTLGFLQSEGLVGSCPFLYTWNGETYEFISDVLGITPLGLPIAPGVLVPPDHDEYVLVRGEQLRAQDGLLELQFTEELREVTYLDRVRLDVVDHPAGSEIYPDERFTFPPFPAPHTHTVTAPLTPLSAVDAGGVDWARELEAIDGVHAVPFEPAPPQVQGIASPHYLELAFDPARVAGAEKLRLIMTGWLWWSNASVNMAIARDPRYDFVPPMIQVPDGEGGWRDTGPPVGFPAGKTKSMVIDVTELLDPEDPRLRVFSTLRLHWDSIRLATDGDDAELRVTSLEPTSAELWRRGFSEPVVHTEPQMPETFAWDRVSEIPRWNPHPGLYTRLGETLPLVETIDDRFVIMASGDALRVRFDARALPPVPAGWRRDYLVFLDGWAKDRDPNTIEALTVEPLPFHGMSGYPYGPDESFPNTPEHRAWRREWNTRLAEPWLPLVAGTGAGGL